MRIPLVYQPTALLSRWSGLCPRIRLVLEFLLYAILTVFMLHATWLTWPDAFIDFSRELYLPWRVSCGDVLYRDLAYYFGPLSVYANAALFALLGRPSVHALFALNFVFWLATLLALRALLRRLAHPAVAALAVSSFILLFSFNRYIMGGNFNYISPYSHELPRGLLLALLSLLTLDSALKKAAWAPSGRGAKVQMGEFALAFLSGFLLGLALFTKPEIALAAVSATAVLFLAHFLRGRGRSTRDGGPGALSPSLCPSKRPSFILRFSIHAAGAFCAVGMVLLSLSLALGSFSQALCHGLLKLYLDCFNPALTSIPFFQTTMGTDDIPLHLLWLVLGTALALLPFILLRLLLPRISSTPGKRSAWVLLVLLAAAIGFFGFNPLNAPLVLAPVAFGVFALRGHERPVQEGTSATQPPSDCGGNNRPLALAFAVFSFLLVSKMLLNASITFYGFVLALPAFCCAILFFFRPLCSWPRAAMALALLLGFSAAALRLHATTVRQWEISCPVHDAACLAPRHQANAFNAALDWIRSHTPADSTLVVLPEGAVLNVLSGRPNPTPFVSLPVTDYPRYDESALLAAYSNNLPDTLVIVKKTGSPDFGTDYAKPLFNLLNSHYAPSFAFAIPTSAGPTPFLLIATRVHSP